MRNLILQRAISNAKLGLACAAAFSLFGILAAYLSGFESFREKYGISLVSLTVFYAVGFGIGGGVAGTLLPWGRSTFGAAIVGFIASLPLSLSGAFIFPFVTQSTLPEQAKYVVLFSLLIGPASGIMVKQKYGPRPSLK